MKTYSSVKGNVAKKRFVKDIAECRAKEEIKGNGRAIAKQLQSDGKERRRRLQSDENVKRKQFQTDEKVFESDRNAMIAK
jgi:hypothetical protein